MLRYNSLPFCQQGSGEQTSLISINSFGKHYLSHLPLSWVQWLLNTVYSIEWGYYLKGSLGLRLWNVITWSDYSNQVQWILTYMVPDRCQIFWVARVYQKTIQKDKQYYLQDNSLMKPGISTKRNCLCPSSGTELA